MKNKYAHNFKVGDVVVALSDVNYGDYDEGDIGVVTDVTTMPYPRVKYPKWHGFPIFGNYRLATPEEVLSHVKANLADTQASYDCANRNLDKAKAQFKDADEAHGKAIEEYNKAYRAVEAKKTQITEEDLKFPLAVHLKADGNPSRLIVKVSGELILVYDGTHISNRYEGFADISSALRSINAMYAKDTSNA